MDVVVIAGVDVVVDRDNVDADDDADDVDIKADPVRLPETGVQRASAGVDLVTWLKLRPPVVRVDLPAPIRQAAGILDAMLMMTSRKSKKSRNLLGN